MYQKNRRSLIFPQSPSPVWSRRHVLTGGSCVIAGGLLPGSAAAQPSRPADGFQIIRAQVTGVAGNVPPTIESPTWAFDGAVPGPLIRVRRGEEIRVRIANELSEAIAVHWHGVRVPNAMDGAPYLSQVPIAPGTSFDYRFTPPDAGTFWYHARLSPAGAPRRSLYGVLIVDETQPIEIDRDVLLVLDEWPLKADRALDQPKPSAEAATAPHPIINGRPSLDIPVRSNQRVRLRLVNASLRSWTLRLERHRVMVMAIDGIPAAPYYARDGRLLLGPGNRMDLLVDATLDPGTSSSIVQEGERDALIARIVYDSGPAARPAPLPEAIPLPPSALPERMDFQRALKLDFPIAGKTEGTDLQALARVRPLFSVRRGRSVMLGLVNRTESTQVMHLHGHHFRLLDALDDGWKPFWLDTLPIPASQTGRIAFVADNPGKWLIHCHRMGNQDTSMARWFEVTS
jgi:FtsP/CotA-like multicopper oxidase with cupredoxin domain